jgi:hypothetical protein
MSKLLDELVSKGAAEVSAAAGGIAHVAMPWWMKLVPYVLVVVIVASCGWSAYRFGVKVEHQARLAEVAQLRQQQTRLLAAVDRANRDALSKARADVIAAQQKAAADMAALDAKHFQELNDANAKADAAVAAVRAGTLRVRKRLTCPTAVRSDGGAGGAAAQAAASAGVGDGTGARGLSADDVQILLRIGERANGVGEKLKACQAILAADRLDQ